MQAGWAHWRARGAPDGPTPLNFGGQKKSGAFDVVWLSATLPQQTGGLGWPGSLVAGGWLAGCWLLARLGWLVGRPDAVVFNLPTLKRPAVGPKKEEKKIKDI